MSERIVSFDLRTTMPMKYLDTEHKFEQFAVHIRRVFSSGIFGRTVWLDRARQDDRGTTLTLQFSLDYSQTYPDETAMICQIGRALEVKRLFGPDLQWTLSGWECWYVGMTVNGGDGNGRGQESTLAERVYAHPLRGQVHSVLEFWR